MAEKKPQKDTVKKPAAGKSQTTDKPAEKSASVKKTTPKAEKPAETKAPAIKNAEEKKAKNQNGTAQTKKQEKSAAITKVPTEKKDTRSKAAKQQPAKSGGAAALFADKKFRIIIISAVALLLVLAITLGVIFGVKSCNSGYDPAKKNYLSNITIPTPTKGNYIPSGDLTPDDPYEEVGFGEEHLYTSSEAAQYSYGYDPAIKTNTAVGFSSKKIGTVERKIPEKTRDEGLGVYPKYGSTLSTVIGGSDENIAARNALIYESSYLTATGTWNAGGGNYKWMDENGYLYNGTTADPEPTLDKGGKHRRLYKHSAADGLYLGNVSDDEPAIIKQVTMRPRAYTRGYGITGVYAPAGELVKIQLSEADMNATGGIVIHIGQALYNGKANNIWTQKGQMQRIPHLLNTMTVDKNTSTYDEETHTYTAYVGSFIGGPVYIRNESVTFTATVSGGVAYSHYILGYTSKAEFEENAKSSAPYFDLEVWDNGVLHSGPKYYAQRFSYDDIYKVAVLWDKVASVTTTGSTQGIVFLYDPFVAAGAAVAFPGQGSVNCPSGWMANSLNYDGIVTSGAWGNFHEYHHNFQGYGVGNGGEVTNNAMTLVSYALFTKISANRGITGFGSSGGGWNNYTSATWALEEVLKIARPDENPSNGNQGLALYATLLHNFGPDAFIKAKLKGGGQSYQAYANAWEAVTHNNMSYYFNDVLQGNITSTAPSNYSMFVPVSSVYQTGRSYMYDGQKKYITTMQPYVIPFGNQFTVDLRKYSAPSGQYSQGSVVLPEGFSYTVKSITQPENGKIEKTDVEGVYTYTPDSDKTKLQSGKIKVTLGITKDDNSFKVDDVDLILEFQQSHETNKMQLERTTYTYTADSMYTDATVAYENNFAGYTGEPVNWAHSNPTQNSNTDIWFCTEANADKFPNADPDKHFVKDNTIEVLKGKLYFEEEGKYRIYLRGRVNCAVYYSVDGGTTYTLGAKVTSGSGSAFYLNNPETYFDLELKGNAWVHFKEVLIVQSKPMVSYIGLGYAKWTEPIFTMVDKYYDKNGNEVDSEDAEGYDHTVTYYYDYMGNPVTEEEASRAELIPPTKASYINAYRSDYEFPSNKDFETEYFYKRKYTYNYVGTPKVVIEGKTQKPTADCNYIAWDPVTQGIQNLFDGRSDTGIHFSNKWGVSASNPAILAFDIGEEVTANTLTLYTYSQNNQGAKAFPKNFTLQGSVDGVTYFDMGSWTNQSVGSAAYKDFQLSDTFTFRYYKLSVTASQNGRCALNGLTFSHTLRFSGGTWITPDDEAFIFSENWKGVTTASTFGHVYVGKAGDTLKFNFTGTRFAILSSNSFGKNFEVFIDGKKVQSEELKDDNGANAASFISNLLTSGEHSVEIRCTGEASIDSIALFP